MTKDEIAPMTLELDIARDEVMEDDPVVGELVNILYVFDNNEAELEVVPGLEAGF